MPASFFFYDLETSGINPREARIMQFAGQRTDMDLQPIGEPVNLLIRLTDDALPDPDAILITGITPQMTLTDGLTEVEFLRHFTDEVATPHTIFLGYNTVRFDDEFMRCLHYRNFYDPYEWQWQDGRSKWDLLDVVRMTRALRPGGIEWPFDVHGRATNRLELITALNKLAHAHAHDALSDVTATIEVARLIMGKQPKLFDYLLSMRDKKKVVELVNDGQPFVYTSGRYPAEFEKTTVAIAVCSHPKKQAALVYDLRYDPTPYKDMSADQIAENWRWKKERAADDEPRLPVKTLQFNHCPAVAPLGVLDDSSKERLRINLDEIKQNRARLHAIKGFAERLQTAQDILDGERQTSFLQEEKHVDGRMYDGFLEEQDRQALRVVRAAEPSELGSLGLHFRDERLAELLPLYKARNFAKYLTDEERAAWETFRKDRLLKGGQRSRLARYFAQLQDIMNKDQLTGHQQYLLEELKLYGESIMPEADE